MLDTNACKDAHARSSLLLCQPDSLANMSALDAQVYQRVHPREFLKRFLLQDVRPDGRAPMTARRSSITTGSIATAVGSAMLKMGRTTAVAGVRATLETPEPGAPEVGMLDVKVELLPIAASHYRPGRVSDDAVCLSEFVRASVAPHIDLSKICVEAGVLVWRLSVTIYCLDHDGNLEDAVLLAAVAALQNVKLPAVRMKDDAEAEDDTDERMRNTANSDSAKETPWDSTIAVASGDRKVPLELDGFPISVSFGLFEDRILLDPSLDEEVVCDSRVTLLMRPSGDLRAVIKPGGTTLPDALFKSCLAQAQERVPYLLQILRIPKSGG